jgi:NitT/TauT family transport system substrate-binding protein
MPARRIVMISIMVFMALAAATASIAQDVRLGTWKTAQTIQPFFYEQFLPAPYKAQVFPFTNPADQ